MSLSKKGLCDGKSYWAILRNTIAMGDISSVSKCSESAILRVSNESTCETNPVAVIVSLEIVLINVTLENCKG